MVKVAVTLLAALMLTLQLPLVLVQAPLQPAKTLPEEGTAVMVTLVPALKDALQTKQLIPAGTLVTAPAPVPTRLKLRVNVGAGATVKFCVTGVAAL